ncbi:MAG TPA: carboxypeptidase-like regulatory domain-containing protein, partial [Blastocatellia bacterium]
MNRLFKMTYLMRGKRRSPARERRLTGLMNRDSRLRRGARFISCALAVVLCASLVPVSAQGVRGTISGEVTDANGAGVAGATVRLIQSARQQEVRSVQTGDDGRYQFLELEPSVYEIVVTASGFTEKRLMDVKVEPNRNLQVDIPMGVAGASETLNITAGQELIDRESPALGTTVEHQRVEGLPLNGRNVLGLALLQPGVTASNLNTTDTFGQGAGVRVNGQRGVENNLTLDGANNNEVAIGDSFGPQPRPDAVEEFRLLTSNYEAEFGRNTGSVINVVTRGGTSEFHGNLRFFYRPTFLSSA